MNKINLLLAEDNPGDVFLVRRALDSESVPYDLVVARDGEEAIAYIAEADSGSRVIDLLLIDLNLPSTTELKFCLASAKAKLWVQFPLLCLRHPIHRAIATGAWIWAPTNTFRNQAIWNGI